MAAISWNIKPQSYEDIPQDRAQAAPVDVSFGESFYAAAELSAQHLPVREVYNWISGLDDDPNEETLSPEELNKRYDDLGGVFNAPLKVSAAESIATKHRREKQLQQMIDQGPQGFWASAGRFGAMLLPHALDPINILGGFAASAALKSATAVRLLGASKFGKAITSGRGFLSTATEGVVGNVPGEVAAYYGAKRDLQEYGIDDAFINAAGGAIGFAGAKYGLGQAGRFLRNVGDEHIKPIVEATLARALSGKKPDISGPFIKDFVAETNSTFFPYDFQQKESLANSKMWLASKDNFDDYRTGRVEVIGESYALDSFHLSDNENVAHGSAGRKQFKTDGKVYEIDLGNANLLNLDQPNEIMFSKIKEIAPKVKGTTVKELLDDVLAKVDGGSLDESVIVKIQNAAKEAGFNGYRYVAGDFMGEKHGSHNVAILFDSSKITKATGKAVERQAVGGLSRDEYADLVAKNFNRSDEIDYHQSAQEELDKVEEFTAQTEVEIEKDIQAVVDDLNSMAKQEGASRSLVADLEKIKENVAQMEEMQKVYKAAFHCVENG